MRTYNSIAVFDLDGTLWMENSHLYVLDRYYKTKFLTQYFLKFCTKYFLCLCSHI